MRKIFISLLALSTIALLSCGDDDEPTGPEPDTTVVVTAVAAAAAPSETSVNDAAWNSATAKSLALTSGQLAVKNRPPAAMSIASTISIKALTHGNNLYLRMTWSDPTFDIWPNAWVVDSLAGTSPEWERLSPYQDGLLVLFSGLPSSGWDVWQWQAHSSVTSGAPGTLLPGFAEGLVLRSNVLTVDAGALEIVTDNVRENFNQPNFLHNDTCDFSGFILPEAEADSVITMPLCWVVGDTVPGFVTHQGVADSSATARGSRFDTQAWATYGSDSYTVVLKRALNTGNADDLVLTAGSDITVKVAIANQVAFTFTQGSAAQGMTPVFYLRLP